MFEYSNRAQSYKYVVNTQRVEGGHNSMCILTNKRKFYPKSYAGRIDASFIRLERGDLGLLSVLQTTNSKIIQGVET